MILIKRVLKAMGRLTLEEALQIRKTAQYLAEEYDTSRQNIQQRKGKGWMVRLNDNRLEMYQPEQAMMRRD